MNDAERLQLMVKLGIAFAERVIKLETHKKAKAEQNSNEVKSTNSITTSEKLATTRAAYVSSAVRNHHIRANSDSEFEATRDAYEIARDKALDAYNVVCADANCSESELAAARTSYAAIVVRLSIATIVPNISELAAILTVALASDLAKGEVKEPR